MLCLGFILTVQGDQFEEVKAKLEAEIVEYGYDVLAVAGEDKPFVRQSYCINGKYLPPICIEVMRILTYLNFTLVKQGGFAVRNTQSHEELDVCVCNYGVRLIE